MKRSFWVRSGFLFFKPKISQGFFRISDFVSTACTSPPAPPYPRRGANSLFHLPFGFGIFAFDLPYALIELVEVVVDAEVGDG
jgi:hypothetical protein